jgi:hypothetical protein
MRAMTETAPPPSPPAPSPTVRLAVWLGLQLLVLLIPITQTPLSDKFPRPAERQALDELLIAQVILAAAFSPFLFRSWTATLVLVAATWPLQQLAGMLSAYPPSRVLEGSAYATLWILVVAGWQWVAGGEKGKNVVAAAASLLAVGGAILAYLDAEFAPGSGDFPGLDAYRHWGPAVGTLSTLHESAGWRPWLTLFWLAALTLAMCGFRLRQVLHRRGASYPQTSPVIHT